MLYVCTNIHRLSYKRQLAKSFRILAGFLCKHTKRKRHQPVFLDSQDSTTAQSTLTSSTSTDSFVFVIKFVNYYYQLLFQKEADKHTVQSFDVPYCMMNIARAVPLMRPRKIQQVKDIASCSRKRSVVTLEKKLEVIALLKDLFKVTSIFKITDTIWSNAAQISGVRLCCITCLSGTAHY